MKYSVINIVIIFLFLTQNIHDCDSEPTTLLAIGLVSSLVTIGSFLWQSLKDSPERNLIEKILSNSCKGKLHERQTNFLNEFSDLLKISEIDKNFIRVMRLVSNIDEFYHDMKRYNESHSELTSKKKMIWEAEANLSHELGRPIGILRTIHQYIVSVNKYNVMSSFILLSKGGYLNICSKNNNGKSIQQYLLEFFSIIEATQIKVYLTVQIASEILKTYTAENYQYDIQLINNELVKKHNSIAHKFKTIMTHLSREVWRCDPSHHIEDVTFTKLNNVFQKIIIRESDMDINQECSQTCDARNPQTVFHWDIKRGIGIDYRHTIERVCAGQLWDCGSTLDINYLQALKICNSALNSSRRYDYYEKLNQIIPFGDETHYGLEGNCDDSRITYEEIHYEYLNKCDVCLCTCDDMMPYSREANLPSERYFYAGPVYSDVSNNYILTGARIVKNDGIISIQIQQGRLLEHGIMNASTVSWQTIQPELHSPRNLITMHWSSRNIELADIDVPRGHVLVGLQIEKISNSGIERLRLKALSLPVNLTNANISYTQDNELHSTTSDPLETGIDLENCDLPDPKIKSKFIATNKHLNFATSSMTRDLGQTTIPFLDIQNVTTDLPMPMGGAGFYYKYKGECQGYLGLKLKTYDFSQHF